MKAETGIPIVLIVVFAGCISPSHQNDHTTQVVAGKISGVVVSDSGSATVGGAGLDMALDLGDGVEMEMVWVEALKGWVGKYEVTNQEYRKFNPKHTSQQYKGLTLNEDRQPAVEVSYDRAVEFCKWVDQKAKVPQGYHVRLPNGQEWLTYAQCGDGREYPWGNEWPPKYGNYQGQEGLGPVKIAGYNDGHPVSCVVELSGKNDWGLYGVGGNVFEWTSEPYESGKDWRVIRDASWLNPDPKYLRCSHRRGRRPWDGSHKVGFRVVVLR